MSTRLLLIRHAHIDVGDPPRLCGTFDLPLSRRGREQLAALCGELSGALAPVALYSSPLARAVETADAIARVCALRPTIDEGLREIDCGALEGRLIAQIEREDPDLWRRNLAQQEDDFRWPGGESYAEFRRRIVAALDRIAVSHPGDEVAVVTHSGVIAQVLGIIEGRAAAVWEQDRPDPLAITEVTWTPGGPLRRVRFNQPMVVAGPAPRLE